MAKQKNKKDNTKKTVENKKSLIVIFIFAIIGVLFAGFLTFTKYILGYCPLKEPCPVIFGQPACVYGLALYIILLFGSSMLLFNKKCKYPQVMQNVVLYVSLAGILFALYSTYLEIFLIKCPGGCQYSLLLPTCIYGLTMYVVIFVSSIVAKGCK